MHHHPTPPWRYVLSNNGTTAHHDLEDVLDALKRRYGAWVMYAVDTVDGPHADFDVRIEDADGLPVDLKRLKAVADARCRRGRPDRNGRPKGQFRCGAWPGIHRRSYRGVMRYPRHKAGDVGLERTRGDLAADGLGTSRRNRVSKAATANDDILRHTERSWKTQRRTRWKEPLR